MSLTITLHMVASLDGKIAKPDNSIGWFDTRIPTIKASTCPIRHRR